jgi:hypothetical protein
MRWFRANRVFGSSAALFALAVLLALSFGHIHREDIQGPVHAAAAASAATSSRSLPTDIPSKHGDDYCAICATMSLLSSSFVADPPQLALPVVSYAVEHVGPAAVVSIAPPRTAFRSRAPPLA